MGHVAVFNIPALGHLYPTLGVVAELTRRGHRVSYASIEARAQLVESVGATLVPYLSSRPTDTDTWDPPPDRSQYLAHSMLGFLTEAELTLPQLESAFEADPPELVVYDRLSFAGRAYAAKHGIPSVQSWPMLVSNEHWSLFEDFGPFDTEHPTFQTYLAKLSAFLAAHGLDLPASEFLNRPEPVLELCYYPREFQYRGELFADRYRFVGPCPRPSTVDRSWTPPGDGAPVVLVALGTLDNRHPGFFHDCIEAFTAPGWHAVLAVGRRLDPASFRPHPASIEVHQVVAQPEVLAHASAMVCHAGLGSVMEALHLGVPLVLVPRTMEQESNAARVAELGLGVVLSPDAVTPHALRAAVDRVESDPAIAARIAALRERMREAGGAVAAADAIEAALAGAIGTTPAGAGTGPHAAPGRTADRLRHRLAELVVAACDGTVDTGQVLGAGSLVLIGVGSLAQLRLIDAVEGEFGVPLDIDGDPSFLDSVDGLAAQLVARGPGAGRVGDRPAGTVRRRAPRRPADHGPGQHAQGHAGAAGGGRPVHAESVAERGRAGRQHAGAGRRRPDRVAGPARGAAQPVHPGRRAAAGGPRRRYPRRRRARGGRAHRRHRRTAARRAVRPALRHHRRAAAARGGGDPRRRTRCGWCSRCPTSPATRAAWRCCGATSRRCCAPATRRRPPPDLPRPPPDRAAARPSHRAAARPSHPATHRPGDARARARGAGAVRGRASASGATPWPPRRRRCSRCRSPRPTRGPAGAGPALLAGHRAGRRRGRGAAPGPARPPRCWPRSPPSSACVPARNSASSPRPRPTGSYRSCWSSSARWRRTRCWPCR